MHRFAALAALILLAAPLQARVPAPGVQNELTAPHVPAQLLVKTTPGTADTVVADLLAPFGAVVLASHPAGRLVLAAIDDDANLGSAIELVAADLRIEYAHPNYLFERDATPNDLDFARQWAKDNTGVNAPNGLGTPGADMNMVAAWDTRSSAANVILAIIDDSLDTTHVDLVGNVLTSGKCFASPNSASPCSNGPNDPNPSDADDFHGTLVAGSAGASGNNGIGIAGTAWELGLLPLKVDLSTFAIVAAIDEAIAQGAHIINMSFGGPVQGTAQSEAITRAQNAGILMVASAGNSDANNDIALHFPSDSTQPNVLSIAATTASDQVAEFSQWASFDVDLAAPGQQTLTTANGNAYSFASGTSFSAPHVAGVAALLQAEYNPVDYEQLKAYLLYGGVEGVTTLGPVVPGASTQTVPARAAAGRLDAARALAGPPGGVIIIEDVRIDDSVSGNGNGLLDPGETASLEIVLRNHWLAETAVSGTLSSDDLVINDATPQLFGNITRNGAASAAFSVTLAAAASGNEQRFLSLALSSAAGALPARYFYLETGTLTNGSTVTQQIQRYDWDEFHAWHIDMPVGASNLFVSTSGSGDIDLLLRHDRSPEYLISLDAERGGFYYVDRDTVVSGNAGADESISVLNPLPGTYHVVVVNYDQNPKTYELTASYAAPGADIVAFSAGTYTAGEGDGQAVIGVVRSGGVGPASVDYATAPGSATPTVDYVSSSGTLNWAAGESGTKTFSVPLVDDLESENGETVLLMLSNASGTTPGVPSSATLTINDNDAAAGIIAFDTAQQTVGESAGTVQLRVTRSNGSGGVATVDYRTQGANAVAGADFDNTNGTLRWEDGDTADKTIEIIINDDAVEESDENFTVLLENASAAEIGSPDSQVITIDDNDTTAAPAPDPAPVPAPSGGGGGGAIGILLLGVLGAIGLLRRRLVSTAAGPAAWRTSIFPLASGRGAARRVRV
ncbi:MAG: S8 family serine peptidase [Gammaproteobacteria bacterium]|nr:S8 family serine peptidase [Gammaproteobacteria bacterium]NNF60109.1 S8 family serine peptidase [Gammaproteobacteria bacterium]NNM21521.1 S8 family serine peptidase [Gammaproteobacteria bacterium]